MLVSGALSITWETSRTGLVPPVSPESLSSISVTFIKGWLLGMKSCVLSWTSMSSLASGGVFACSFSSSSPSSSPLVMFGSVFSWIQLSYCVIARSAIISCGFSSSVLSFTIVFTISYACISAYFSSPSVTTSFGSSSYSFSCAPFSLCLSFLFLEFL